MNIKYKKPNYLYGLIPFGLLLLFGLLSIFACHGECGASNHGGLLQYVHYKVYIPSTITNICIAFGALGVILALLIMVYRFVFIYEARLDVNGITVIKVKKDVFFDYYGIGEIEYKKPTVFNYLTLWMDPLLPGILLIKMKDKNRKDKMYFIRLKYKDFKKLPPQYKKLIKPMV